MQARSPPVVSNLAPSRRLLASSVNNSEDPACGGAPESPGDQHEELASTSSSEIDPEQFNTVQLGNVNGDIKCCCFRFKGALRSIYRNRLNYLVRIKAISGFLEMIVAMMVMFGAAEETCNLIRYWILAWVIRLPMEMPLLSERLNGQTHNNQCIWVFDCLWNVGWFSYGVFLSVTGQCLDESVFVYSGLQVILAISVVCCFSNWPFVAVWIHHKLENMRPILPHLPHFLYKDYKKQDLFTEHDESCVICMNPYRANNVVTQLPCHHAFHQHCINIWLQNHNTCPMCRSEVPDDGWVRAQEQRFMTTEALLEQEIEQELANMAV